MNMRWPPFLVVLPFILVASAGCSLRACSAAPSPAPAAALPGVAASSPPVTDASTPKEQDPRNCFNVYVDMNSKGTNAVFSKHHLQAGGPTWAAILNVLIAKEAKVSGEEVPPETPGLPGFGAAMSATFQGTPNWFVIDDEGDGTILCFGSWAFMSTIQAGYRRVNSDSKELEQVLAQAGPDLE